MSPFAQLVVGDLGATPSGRQWALTALHPCGKGEITSSALGDLVGMPDTMTGAVVTPAYPGETNIKFDPSMFPTPPTTGFTTWGIDIVIPPIPEIDYMYRIHDDQHKLVSNWRVMRLPNFDNPYFEVPPTSEDDLVVGTTMGSVGYGRVRCIASGHTFTMDASATNDQGRVVVSQLAGQWTDYKLSPNLLAGSSAEAVTSVDFANQQTTAQTFIHTMTSAAADAGCNVQILSIPTDPTVLVSACPNSYQGEARCGAYVVSKFSSPLLGYPFAVTADNTMVRGAYREYYPGGDVEDPTTIGVARSPTFFPSTAFGIKTDSYSSRAVTLGACDMFTTDSQLGANSNIELPFGYDQPINPVAPFDEYLIEPNKVHPFVSGRSEMMTAVITFRNLIVTDAATSAGASATVRVKSRNYYEAIPHAQNPATTPFTHQPAPYDMKALEAVIVTGKQLADGYPASYNDLGQILGSIGNALLGGGKSLLGGVKDANIPIVSQLAGLLGNIL
jgi:hypothetical protein